MTTYYVDFAAGNDANPGTVGSPFATVQFPFNSFLLNPGDVVQIKSGTYTIIGKMLNLINFKQGDASSYVTVQGASDVTLNCTDTPITGMGSCRFLRFKDLNCNIDHTTAGAFGVNIDGRNVAVGDGLGAAHIIVENCVFQSDSAYVDRSGISIAGADYVQVIDNTVQSVAANASAVGGIVLRSPYSYDTTAGIHIRCERNFVVSIGDAATTNGDHRDAILLQDYHTDQPFGGSLLTNRLIGDTLIANNLIVNVAGRGIGFMRGGLPDSKIGIINNTVVAPFAFLLGSAVPQCGIGGFGQGQFSDITYFNNLVIGDQTRFNYEFLDFTMIGALVGARNWSYNGVNQYSPLASEPMGWLYGTFDPMLVNPLADGTGDYAPQASSSLVGGALLTFNGWDAPLDDFNGVTRVGAPTIGAIQVNSGAGSVPVCDFTVSPAIPGAGSAVTFTDTSTNTPNSFQWDFGDGYQSLDANPVHTYITSGDYIVTHVVSNAFGANTKVSSISVAPRGT